MRWLHCLVTATLTLFLAACVIPPSAEIEAAAASETVHEDVPADPELAPETEMSDRREVVGEPEPEGPPLFGSQELVDRKDANPVRFNWDWGGLEVRVVGTLADIDLRPGRIRLTVNKSGIDYFIGFICILERTDAADAAVAVVGELVERLGVLAACLRYVQHLPTARWRNLLRELHGVALAMGTVEALCQRVAQRLATRADRLRM